MIAAAVLRYIRNIRGMYFLFLFIMFLYLLNVAKLTLFPFPLASDAFAPNIRQSLNLIPFINGVGRTDFYNVLLMAPLGFGAPFVLKIRTNKKLLLIAFLSGIVIESLQLGIALVSGGFTFRTIDVNDVIFNFVGTLVGYVLLHVFAKVFLRLVRNRRNGLTAFWAYVFDVCVSLPKFNSKKNGS
ncbi:MAG: VanZ family protein [Clostridiales Family XIII bacterium]|nr:VanZ family protein [Clostridiales Family XIII bacterium]